MGPQKRKSKNNSKNNIKIPLTPTHMLPLLRLCATLYSAIFLVQFASILLISYLALRLSESHGAAAWGGALMAANALGWLLGGWLASAMIERYGRTRTYVLSASVILIAALSHALTDALPVWLLMRAILGVFMSFQTVVIESWLSGRVPGAQRGRMFGLYMLLSYLGMICAQLMIRWEAQLGLYMLLIAATAFFLSQFPVLLTRPAIPPHSQTPTPPPRNMRALARRAPKALATALCVGLLNGCFYGLGAIYAVQKGLDRSQIALFMAVPLIAGLLAQAPMGWLSDHLPRVRLIRACALAVTLACLALAWQQAPAFGTMLMLGAIIGAFQFSLYALCLSLATADLEPEHHAPMIGLLLVAFSFGVCIGPLLGGLGMELWGTSSLYWFCAACAAALAACMRTNAGRIGSTAPILMSKTEK